MTEAENPRAVIGGNEPPPFERLNLRKEELEASAARFLTDHPFNVNLRDMDEVQKAIDAASNFTVQLREAWKETDTQRKVEKAPHDEAAQAVQDKYNPILNALVTRADAVKTRLGQWMSHLGGLRQAAKEAEEKKLAEQKAAAEKAAREAEELARKADAGELQGSGVDVFAKQEEAEKAQAAVKSQEKAVKAVSGTVKGGTGVVDGRKKTVAMRPHYSARIDNPKALLNFLVVTKDPKLLNFLQERADALVRADHDDPPPGVTTMTEMRPA